MVNKFLDKLSYRMMGTDFETWIPVGLLENESSDTVDFLNVRLVVYQLNNGNYEICDDTQWISISRRE